MYRSRFLALTVSTVGSSRALFFFGGSEPPVVPEPVDALGGVGVT